MLFRWTVEGDSFGEGSVNWFECVSYLCLKDMTYTCSICSISPQVPRLKINPLDLIAYDIIFLKVFRLKHFPYDKISLNWNSTSCDSISLKVFGLNLCFHVTRHNNFALDQDVTCMFLKDT